MNLKFASTVQTSNYDHNRTRYTIFGTMQIALFLTSSILDDKHEKMIENNNKKIIPVYLQKFLPTCQNEH